MQVEIGLGQSLLACALMLASASLGAFEPGKARVCEPSADGQRFDCRDKNADRSASSREAPPAPAVVAPAENRKQVGSRVETVPAPVTAPPAAAPSSAPVAAMRSGSARAVPNYLLQKPSPAVATPTPVAEPTVAATEDANPAEQSSSTAAAGATASEPPAPVQPQTEVIVERTRQPSLAPSARMPGAYAGAAGFRQLSPNRYTLEIARARTQIELAALIAALASIDGPLYLVALRTPDGEAYSLLWSDFTTIDAARDARATLPADVAITSGWPRRIGPLQAELVGP